MIPKIIGLIVCLALSGWGAYEILVLARFGKPIQMIWGGGLLLAAILIVVGGYLALKKLGRDTR